jgi:hypothetical protein
MLYGYFQFYEKNASSYSALNIIATRTMVPYAGGRNLTESSLKAFLFSTDYTG